MPFNANNVEFMPRGLEFVPPTVTLDEDMVGGLTSCMLTLHLKAGMTGREANDAINDAFEQTAKCLRDRAHASTPTGE